MKERIDCKNPELVINKWGRDACKWCGRPVKYTRDGKLQHRRGYRRLHPDPRKENS